MLYKLGKTDPYLLPFIAVLSVIILAILIGGGSRADIFSLLILRPIGAIAIAYAVFTCWAACWEHYRPVGLIVAALSALFAVHLVPLPPEIWQSLPGRSVIVEAMTAAELQRSWLPLSMTPDMTWNAAFALLLPLAVLLLALVLPVHRLIQMWLVVGALAGLSALIALFQVIGPEQGLLYFYRVTNVGAPVGLFANRNHAALFHICLFPLMAMHLSLLRQNSVAFRVQVWIAIAIASYVLILTLVSGSRIGLAGMLVGLAAAVWVWRGERQVGGAYSAISLRLTGLLALGALGLAAVALLFSRAVAIDRLLGVDATGDQRFKFMPVVWEGVATFWPLGSGIGSFAEVFQVLEPDRLLAPNYFNHAHNDYLEIALTTGLPGIILSIAALLLLTRAAWPLQRSYNRPGYGKDHHVVGRASVAVIIILLIGSVTDYPLRTPSLAAIFALAVASIFVSLRLGGDSAIGTASAER
jgi:O-antigen ligase